MNFYDTCSLLTLGEDAFKEPFLVSSITLEELEHIKTNKNKTEDLRYKARELARGFRKNDNYRVIVRTLNDDYLLEQKCLPNTNDNLIAAAALRASQDEDITFVTNDTCLAIIAENYFNLKVNRPEEEDSSEHYRGYEEVILSDPEMADFYEHMNENTFGLKVNEYLCIKNGEGELVDKRVWNGEEYSGLTKKNLKSLVFGDKIKPKDEFQHMAIDSIMNNQVTFISGKAGSGKSLIALASAMSLIESGKFERIVMITNPTDTRGAAHLGYMPGDLKDKLLTKSCGNILITKIGDRSGVETLMNNDKLRVVSIGDGRGMEIREGEILYCTEAQNFSVDLMKLMLSRPVDGSKVIIEGDTEAQVDEVGFEGKNNGMKRAIEILAGNPIFGYIEFQNVWRSRLAELVDKM